MTTSPQGPAIEGLVSALRGRLTEMIDALAILVDAESPSEDVAATQRCAEIADRIGTNLLGSSPERLVREGRTHLRWQFGSSREVVLLGHLDTVWPVGTTARWPFEARDGIGSGPGCFDMKAGVVQLFYALGALEDPSGATVLLTTDEELGSPTSKELIEDTARSAKAVLVLEPSAGGALKTERKGFSAYELRVEGRAAHAGLEPESGVNSAIELAHQVLRIADLSRLEAGTTVTPTIVRAGSSENSVPGEGILKVDVRTTSADEQVRVETAMRALTPHLPGARLQVRGRTRPPLPRSASVELFARAQRLALALGLDALTGVAVGGASDGNLTATMGIPTLDGLGAVGAGAHAEGEHVTLAAMPERAALVAALVAELLGEGSTQ